ncbi:hypothetical protein IMSAGC002_04617 [Lachnospiraceae bacterium]|nr:hypothetical protein IMSAGC002_04617 [Lachnospiraceae bacterium]
MTQGERVREIRKKLGFTLEKFGERIGIKKAAMSAIETGKNSLTDANIKAICREFNINEEWLRTGSGEMRIPVEDEAAAAVSDLVEKSNPLYDIIKGIMVAYQKLDGPSREVIDQFILDAVSQRSHPQKAPEPAAPDLSELTIDEKVALYRKELEREEKVAGESQVLQENA